jgi:hypothetical protein
MLHGVTLLALLAVGVVAGTRAEAQGCERTPLAVVVDLHDDRHAPVIDHVSEAVREGQPRMLHIDRAEGDANRALALRGIPARSGQDRDEYPPAMSDEGGAGASVEYVSPRANRSAGATMGRQLGRYCDGQAFIVEAGRP